MDSIGGVVGQLMNQPTNFYQNQRVVVTGASGLLGYHLVTALLEAGALVRAVIHRRSLPSYLSSHANLEIVSADLTQEADCDRVMAGMDLVCLCASVTVGAAQAVKNPMLAVTSNLVMAARSLQAACLAKAKRVLLVSSTTVYPAYSRPVQEEEGFLEQPHPAYQGVGNMKRYVETLAKFYHDQYGLNVAIVRPVPFFGRYDNFDFETCHVIPALIRKAVEKQNPFEVWGTGKDVRDFLHVTDVARGCLLALERYAECDAVNLGSGQAVSIAQLAETITRLANHPVALQFAADKPSTIPLRLVDTRKAEAKLGFRATLSLEAGLADTIQWFREDQYG
ncbi:NAD-dependent epimerase/dehydratase family protein [Kovacikia minuta CCNUW1]|uniref:NAD-dependent epimerase/dehydratase family protein n=1 Tax=Kovacikia minuta TaxID=2931930 RepID=UPI001CCB03E8|nr:NAD-dependent epimerase/dehydratase family protein [Kovacikia minuta]UBF26001.1 NAD-dependent epimerase/dehydratase family protein [Kovacikia minuta CCNUW1]